MKNFIPAPQFMHVRLVKLAERKIGEIVILEKIGCLLGVVITNNCLKDGIRDIAAGKIVFFRPDNFQFLMQDDAGTNGELYEAAILGVCDKADFESTVIDSLDCVKEYGANEIVQVDGSGATVGKRARPNFG